ncbi:MAG: Crp/Fnr family transcriptional regulator [Methyloceanibacter sp.]|jgi:CRP/FNR family transcriptional regulator, cyclic AMP receptor protein|nr:Crp/Fnr family transcriptional regulator [Methyloceanibacter sp.]
MQQLTPDFDPKAFLAEAAEGQTIAKYQNHQVIFTQGDRADAVFYLETGKVKVTVLSQQGKEAVLALLGSGDFFGEGCMTGQTQRMTSAVAMEECTIARLEKAVVLRTIHEEPAFAEMFIAYLLARNLRMEGDLVDQLFNSSEKRLARLLLILANFGKEDEPETVIPKMSQETLAEMVGTTRSRISFFMNKFRRLGLIDYNGHMTVNRSLLNVILYD